MEKEISYFKVYFPAENTRLYDIISQLMCVLTMIVFSQFILYTEAGTGISPYWLVVVAMMAYLVWKYLEHTKGKSVSYSIGLAVSGIIFLTIARGSSLLIGIGFVYLVTAFVERYIKAPLVIEFDEDEIVVKRIFSKHEPWAFVSNVLLKEGMLTIDYKNNKIFQKEVTEDVSPAMEKEFNEFCRSQLKVHASEALVK